MTYNIPMIDFSKCGLHIPDDDVIEQDLKDSGRELYSALSTTGFAYLSNHGIEWSRVDEMNAVGEQFYSLPLETKKKFETSGFVLSYDSIGRTRAYANRIDYYEGFRTGCEAYTDENVSWPDVPGMKECYAGFADTSSKLLLRIMEALGYGMKLKDREYFCRVHSLMNQKGNASVLKTIKYPPVNNEDDATENRLGEHTDRTTLTLLFQDQMGGLQVRDTSDKLVDVQPVPGTIVLNVGDTLEAWSGNRLKATRHRVTVPFNPDKRGHIRRSVAYFAQANDEVLMEKLQFEDDTIEDTADEKTVTVKEYMIQSLSKVLKNL